MAVRDGKIVCIGGIEQIMLECGTSEDVETIQLKNQFVMPGFNDAHVHMGSAGADMLAVRVNGVASIEELQKAVATAVAAHKEGEWIVGSGWDHTLWPDKKFPTRQQLDAVSPKNPVLLVHISGHVAIANSLALEQAGVKKDTPNPKGGEFEHDANGELTGMLLEGSAIGSRPAIRSRDQRRRSPPRHRTRASPTSPKTASPRRRTIPNGKIFSSIAV